jgi:hypothetical protein
LTDWPVLQKNDKFRIVKTLKEKSSLRIDCPVRAALGLQLANAIQDVFRLRADSEAAKIGSDNTFLFDLLREARKDQRNARRALLDHLREHRCHQSKPLSQSTAPRG